MIRVDASTDSASSEFPLETEGRLPMAGGRPVAYLTAWRPAEIIVPTSTATTIDQVSPSPTGTEGSQAAVLNVATDPIAAQAVTRPPTPPPVRLRITERWDGVVIEIHPGDGMFTARVVPLGREEPELYVDFRIDKVDEQDLPLVREGALFFAVTGYIPVNPGQRIQASALQFRRLAMWRRDDVDFMRMSARKRRAALGLSDEE
jgi:hypothetical protein